MSKKTTPITEMSNLMDQQSHIHATPNVLLCTLDDEEFCIPLTQIKQVSRFEPYTPLSGTPFYVLGVLRRFGKIITLINLKQKLGIKTPVSHPISGSIIYINLMKDIVGILVDNIIGPAKLPTELLNEQQDSVSTKINKSNLIGTSKFGGENINLLNIKQLFSEYESQTKNLDRDQLLQKLQLKDIIVLSEKEFNNYDLNIREPSNNIDTINK